MVDTSLMSAELTFMDAPVTDSSQLFAWLAPRLMARGLVRESWLDAITGREEDYPTGLAFEAADVAIPHVDAEHIVRPYIAIVRPQVAARFGGMGGMEDVDARLVINLGLLAHEDEQVAVLQSLMSVFMREDAARDILAQESPEGLVATMTSWCQRCAD